MTFFGETIRKAREAKGLTTSQVADRTHILVQIIEAMEREDFKRIPAAIYGRGFVRHISEVLEIDPQPLVAEFMEIYAGRKPPAAGMRDPFTAKTSIPPVAEPPALGTTDTPPVVEPPATATADIPPVAEPPVHETTDLPPVAEPPVLTTTDVSSVAEPSTPTPSSQPDVVKGLDLFDQTPPPPVVQRNTSRTLWTGNDIQPVIADEDPASPVSSPVPPPTPPAPTPATAQPPPVTRAQDIFSSAYDKPEEKIDLGPSAAEKFRESLSVVSHGVIGGVRKIPRSAWRMAVLVVGAITVIGLLIWGCKVLYRITEQPVAPETPITQPVTPAAQPAKTAPSKAAPAAPVKLRSTGQKVPPLYVD